MKKIKTVKLYDRKPFSKTGYGSDWKTVTKNVKERDGGRCVDCGSTVGVQSHHIIPVSKGGSNHGFNLICLCERCHCIRHKSNSQMQKNYRKKHAKP